MLDNRSRQHIPNCKSDGHPDLLLNLLYIIYLYVCGSLDFRQHKCIDASILIWYKNFAVSIIYP